MMFSKKAPGMRALHEVVLILQFEASLLLMKLLCLELISEVFL